MYLKMNIIPQLKTMVLESISQQGKDFGITLYSF